MAKRNSKKITLASYGGDHGPNTAAQRAGTKVEGITDEKGRNPNNMGRKRRQNAIDAITGLTQRQVQAATAIEEAYCNVERLSSGQDLKERVQSSPRPDRTVALQCEFQSRLVFVTKPVPANMRYVVDHVCKDNRPLSGILGPLPTASHSANLKVALDLVANKLGY